MSELLNSISLSKKIYKNLKILPKNNQKPAEKNINFDYIESITYNLIETMTKFKNNEINNNDLNLGLLGNLSLILTKGELDQKKIDKNKKKKKKNNNDNKKCSIQYYGVYFPTRRITFIGEIKNNNNSENNSQNKIIKRNKFKLPYIHENIETFFPLGKNFLNSKYFKRSSLSNDRNTYNDASYDLILKEKNSNSYYQDSNDNSLSLISEESISIKDINNTNNKEFNESNKSIFKNLKRFKNYKELKDYIECPLIKKNTIEEKCNNLMNLLEKFDDLIEDNNDISDNNLNENLDLNEEVDNNNYKRVFIDNFGNINNIQNINIDIKNNKNNLTSTIYNDKKYKSVNVSKCNNSSDLLFLNSSLKNDLSETLDKTSSSMKQNKSQTLNNNNDDKSKEISSSLKKKYLKKMNDKYILLIHNIYMNFIGKCIAAKNYLNDLTIKKLFVQLFKSYLLFIGISNKKIYEKILKNQIFSNKLLTFDQFIQCFDLIIYDNDSENLKSKFSFLLSILPHENDNDFLNSKNIELFFDLLGCSAIYIKDFCENLGERLVIRYNIINKNDEENNIIYDKYRFRKMKVILESFFDDLQIDT